MGFRFRRSARLGPLRFNFSKGGLSSISVGGRGASLNIPVNRVGGVRTTVGLPGTGLSWSSEQSVGLAAGLPNSRRLRPGQLDAFKRQLLAVLEQELFGPAQAGERLWQTGAVTSALNAGQLGSREAALLALIETPEAMEDYVMRARSRSDARRRAERCVAAVEQGIWDAACEFRQ
jgi:hypothetical protein